MNKVPMTIDKALQKQLSMTPHEKRIDEIKRFPFATAEARHHVDFLLTQLDAANKLAKDLRKALRPMKKLADAWAKDGVFTPASYHACNILAKGYITYGQCKEAKRLVDQADGKGGDAK